jgi:hypothetical protein
MGELVTSTTHPDRVDRSDEAWPQGVTWTVRFPEGEEPPFADLEYAAPLPRVGDAVEYIDEHGRPHRYRVREVVHTLQSSATGRPSIDEATFTPASVARGDADGEGARDVLRAGLPTVVLEAAAAAED